MNISQRIFLAGFAGLFACAPAFAKAPTSITIPMKSMSGSGENGRATLTQLSSGVRVVVELRNGPSLAQPTHIHLGPCSNSTALQYGLKSTSNGTSTTVVPKTTLAELLRTPHSLNIHKSAKQLGTYVSCGDITTS